MEGQRGSINTKTYSGAGTFKRRHPGSIPEDSPVLSAFFLPLLHELLVLTELLPVLGPLVLLNRLD